MPSSCGQLIFSLQETVISPSLLRPLRSHSFPENKVVSIMPACRLAKKSSIGAIAQNRDFEKLYSWLCSIKQRWLLLQNTSNILLCLIIAFKDQAERNCLGFISSNRSTINLVQKQNVLISCLGNII